MLRAHVAVKALAGREIAGEASSAFHPTLSDQVVSDADFHHHWGMGGDPQKAWGLFASDAADFLVMFAIVILAVAWFVWWFRGYLVKERIETNEQRLALAREEQSAVTAPPSAARLARLTPKPPTTNTPDQQGAWS